MPVRASCACSQLVFIKLSVSLCLLAPPVFWFGEHFCGPPFCRLHLVYTQDNSENHNSSNNNSSNVNDNSGNNNSSEAPHRGIVSSESNEERAESQLKQTGLSIYKLTEMRIMV